MKFLLSLLISTVLFASLHTKSAMVYYGKDISYPMVGIHDYIIVQPNKINTHRHGFELYRDKMYAYVSIGEIDKTIPEYKDIEQSWIIAKNKAWNSVVLDLKNVNYLSFLFTHMIEPQIQRGFKNFFFDTLDSYQLASKTDLERKENEKALVLFINTFHQRYPHAKLIVNRGFEVIDKIHNAVDAVLFESYYKGLGGPKLAYKDVSDKDREWLDTHINKIKSYGLDVISVDYLDIHHMNEAQAIADKIVTKGMIPYISNRDLSLYGISAKNAIKREVFTLIDVDDYGSNLPAHLLGGTVLEYMGYTQKLQSIHQGLPSLAEMQHYAGVLIWLKHSIKEPLKLIQWIKKLNTIGLKVVFVGSFGMSPKEKALHKLGIVVSNHMGHKLNIEAKDPMVGYEVEPSYALASISVDANYTKPLLKYKFTDGTSSTLAAIMPWGAYAIDEALIVRLDSEDLWVINPFVFFKEALNLKDLIVPDVTTENGKRLLFSHIDGDGIMNRVEGDFGYYSGDVILNRILKRYKIPHSVSVIGAEIAPNGLYPKLSPALLKIAHDMYALDNVEPATHTFTHPFFWGKIKNNTLSKRFRLKPKGYTFSLDYELSGMLQYINDTLMPKREAKTVFWSGDCRPRKNALDYVYAHHILNINGGDTTIIKTAPWLTRVAPLGLQRDGYTQVYTGAQNENVYTNDWLGPFWGFKKVTQTFELTNSPRRLKPIDIYYHIYSGSKQASIEALEYVFNWALRQDTMPIFTSEYIPKVIDYYEVSMANEGDEWLFDGMKTLDTLRIEKKNAFVNLDDSHTVAGIKHFENHTYLSLSNNTTEHFITLDTKAQKNKSYMISSNAKLTNFIKSDKKTEYNFKGHVNLKLNFHVAHRCKLNSFPKARERVLKDKTFLLSYRNTKKATITVTCK